MKEFLKGAAFLLTVFVAIMLSNYLIKFVQFLLTLVF